MAAITPPCRTMRRQRNGVRYWAPEIIANTSTRRRALRATGISDARSLTKESRLTISPFRFVLRAPCTRDPRSCSTQPELTAGQAPVVGSGLDPKERVFLNTGVQSRPSEEKEVPRCIRSIIVASFAVRRERLFSKCYFRDSDLAPGSPSRS